MAMLPALRKLSISVHIAVSVGWIGAAGAYLVLVGAGMTTVEPLTLRAAWIGMELIGWYLIVPLALTSLGTGLLLAMATSWGVFRHYWVLASLVLTTVATLVLLQHMPTVSAAARAARELSAPDLEALRVGLRGEVLHAGF